jgi:hypothetical protein
MANVDQKTRTAKPGASATETLRAAADHAAQNASDAMKSTVNATKDVTDAAFSQPKFEVPEVLRSFAEQGLNQSREAYGRMKAATEEATDVLEESFRVHPRQHARRAVQGSRRGPGECRSHLRVRPQASDRHLRF